MKKGKKEHDHFGWHFSLDQQLYYFSPFPQKQIWLFYCIGELKVPQTLCMQILYLVCDSTARVVVVVVVVMVDDRRGSHCSCS